MNNVTLKIQIIDVNCTSTGDKDDESILTSGRCGFKFTDRKEEKGRVLNFQAYNEVGGNLADAGVNSVHVVNGSLNQYKPTDGSLNPILILVIKQSTKIDRPSVPIKTITVNSEPVESDFQDVPY